MRRKFLYWAPSRQHQERVDGCHLLNALIRVARLARRPLAFGALELIASDRGETRDGSGQLNRQEP